MRTELTPQQIDSYREQGFLMVSDFLGTPQDGLLAHSPPSRGILPEVT